MNTRKFFVSMSNGPVQTRSMARIFFFEEVVGAKPHPLHEGLPATRTRKKNKQKMIGLIWNCRGCGKKSLETYLQEILKD